MQSARFSEAHLTLHGTPPAGIQPSIESFLFHPWQIKIKLSKDPTDIVAVPSCLCRFWQFHVACDQVFRFFISIFLLYIRFFF